MTDPTTQRSPSRIKLLIAICLFYIITTQFTVFNETRCTTSEAISSEIPVLMRASPSNTAIVITSSWIPSHPSTKIIDAVINSTHNLVGLSPTAPTFVTIDDLPLNKIVDKEQEIERHGKKMEALEEYSMNLARKYMTKPNFHILPTMNHLHIGGSVMKALTLIAHHYPTVEYIYSIQHDFEFTIKIDHDALVQIMKNSPSVNLIRFPFKPGMRLNCGNNTVSQPARMLNNLDSNGDNVNKTRIITIHQTNQYSDNNHFARFNWYKETIASIEMLQRPPEFPLMKRALKGCQENHPMGLYLYDEVSIGHLDGKNSD